MEEWILFFLLELQCGEAAIYVGFTAGDRKTLSECGRGLGTW